MYGHSCRRHRRIGNLVDRQIAQRQAASRYLKDLVGAGVLTEIQAGKEKLFTHPKLIRLPTRDGNDFERYAAPGAATS